MSTKRPGNGIAPTLVKTLNFMKRRGDSVKICKYAIKRKPPDATLRVSSPSFPPLLPSPLLVLVSFSFLNDDPLRSRDYAKFQHEVPCVRFH